MASDALIQFTFAGLPADYCFTTPQRFALDIVANMTGYVPGEYSVIIDSSNEPAIADRNKLWHLRDAGSPTGRLYAYYNGAWVSQHPIPPSDPNYRVWFEGSEADAWAFDGGDGSDPSTTVPAGYTGAMWEVDHNYDFRFPLGAGTSPKPTTVSVGATGGNEQHELSLAELPVDLTIPVQTLPDVNDQYLKHDDSDEGDIGVNRSAADNDVPGSGDAFDLMPPYRVGYWLKRTARVYFLA